MQQEIIEDNSSKNPTFYVDGKRLGYNSKFADSLNFDEVKGVLIHEVMHLVLLHHTRMGKRDVEVWNKACDYAINEELIKNGFKLPKGVLLDPQYNGKNAEEIYRALYLKKIKEEAEKDKQEDNSNGESSDSMDSSGDSGDSNNDESEGNNEGGEGNEEKPVTFGEIRPATEDNAEETAKIQSKQAISIAKAAGEMPGNSIIEMIENSYKPKFNWREIINQFVSEITQKDYSFENPDRRFLQNGIVLPDFYSKAPANIVVAIDTSGSVNLDEVRAIVEETRHCLDIMSEDKDNASLTVIYFDHMVQGVEVFESGSDIKPNPKGGGGTNYAPIFKYIQDNDLKCDACVIITDGYCWDFGKIIPSYPVLWGLTTGCYTFKAPFGEKFEFDIHG
jgi:predicted metal-dependent peptidase